MHTRLFLNPKPLGLEELKGHAAAVGLEAGSFQQCLDSGKHAGTVQQGVADAVGAGISGTPAFFVGVVADDGKSLKAMRFINGAHPFGRFKQEIDAVLAKANERREHAAHFFRTAAEYAESVRGLRGNPAGSVSASRVTGVTVREFAYTCRLNDAFPPKLSSGPTSMFNSLR